MKKHITVAVLDTAHIGKESLYIGEARNTELGAALALKNGTLYLDGQREWRDSKLGKTLLVNGILRKRKTAPSSKSKAREEDSAYFVLESPHEIEAK